MLVHMGLNLCTANKARKYRSCLSLNIHEMLYYGFVAPWEKNALNNEQHLNELESFFMQHVTLEFLFILLSCIIK